MTLSVADRLAVADLVHLYAAAVDDRRFDDVVELFTETAELHLPDPPRSLDPVRVLHGRDGVRAAMKALGGRTHRARDRRRGVCRRSGAGLRAWPDHGRRPPLDASRRPGHRSRLARPL
jgi:hypothetical protein